MTPINEFWCVCVPRLGVRLASKHCRLIDEDEIVWVLGYDADTHALWVLSETLFGAVYACAPNHLPSGGDPWFVKAEPQ